MSIQSQINRIAANVRNTLDIIAGAGITVPAAAGSDDLPALTDALANGDIDCGVFGDAASVGNIDAGTF